MGKKLKLIELVGKKPVTSFNTFIHAIDADNVNGYGAVLDTETIVVDFDEMSRAAEKLALEFKTLKVNTSRGFHLYFKRPKKLKVANHTGKTTVLGIKVDYKTGTRSQGTIKLDGQVRQIENEHFMEDMDSLPELPVFLYPTKTRDSLTSLVEGDGRNSALYHHLCNILEQYPDFKHEGILYQIALYINSLVFAEPLEDEERNSVVESVLKKELATNQLYLDENDLNMTAKYLARRLKIHRFQGKLYFYNEKFGSYDCEDNRLRRAVYNSIELLHKKVNVVLEQFHMVGKQIDDNAKHPVQVGGGYILDNGEPIELEAEFTPLATSTRYNPDAYCERTDKFLDFLTCNDKELRMLVEEVMGHVLLTHEFPHKAFFFTGESGGNGKSTFIELLRGMVGDDLVANVPLEKFDDSTMIHSLSGKLVNLADDIDDSFLEKSGNFKSLVSGDTIAIRPIYSPPFVLKNTATMIFTCNETPKFKDKTGGLSRRIIVIPCENTLKEEEFDMTLKDHLRHDETSRSYALNLAIKGAARLKANGNKFSKVERSERATKDYLLDNDLIAQFFSQHKNITDVFEGQDIKSCYNFFIAWCVDELGESGDHIQPKAFGRAVKKYTGLVSKVIKRAGKSVRIYEKE